MPSFLPNFTELKGLASSFNPLNAFSSAEPSTTPVLPPTNATAGPGPSTLAKAHDIVKSPANDSAIGLTDHIPVRDTTVTPTDSRVEPDGGRKSIGGNVSIALPEVSGEARLPTRSKSQRGERPMSIMSGTTELSRETRRKKKRVPLDTYVIVKPPTTSSKNPLNLQIQLVINLDPCNRNRSSSGASSTPRDPSESSDTTISSPLSHTMDLPHAESNTPVIDLTPSPEAIVTTQVESSLNPEDNGASGLTRSLSSKSSVSTRSSSASTASSVGTGSKKRVEPMFNLTVHNVMHSTMVTDAATDVKVAKFLKRLLDIAGVGLLEPSEVRHVSSSLTLSPSLFVQSSNSDDENHLNRRSSRPQSIASFSHPVSPSAAPIDDVRSSLDLQRESSPAGLLGHEGEGRKSKQFFGKIFKKKAARDLSPSMQSTHNRISPSSSFVSLDGVPPLNPGTNGYRPPIHAKAPLMNTTSNISEHAQGHHPVGHATFGTAPLIIRRRSSGTMVTAEGAVTGLTGPASLGLSLSNLSSASADQGAALPMLPSSRPVGYTWTVRKWAKKNTDGWAAQIVAAAASGLEMVNGTSIGGANDDVVFEWVKMRVPFSSVGSSITTRYSVAGSISDRTRSQSRGSSGLMLDSRAAASSSSRLPANLAPPRRSDSPLPPHSSPMSSPQLVARPEQMRRVSASTAPSSRRESASESEVTVEDGEDSDPEDSETPWACSIWVKKTGHRQLLGTLTPAPHHPKVIGILKIPVALGSVSLTDPQANKGHHHDMASRVREGVALTEENLKDVVCVTAMWLVAREEFGGLGRKRKV